MAQDDFYVASWAQRVNELEVERSEALTDLARAKASGDYGIAGEACTRLAKMDAGPRIRGDIQATFPTPAGACTADPPRCRSDARRSSEDLWRQRRHLQPRRRPPDGAESTRFVQRMTDTPKRK